MISAVHTLVCHSGRNSSRKEQSKLSILVNGIRKIYADAIFILLNFQVFHLCSIIVIVYLDSYLEFFAYIILVLDYITLKSKEGLVPCKW